MLEIAETYHLSKQINQFLVGKQVKSVIANKSSHKFAWLNQNLDDYNRLIGNKVNKGSYHGAYVEIQIGNDLLTFSDGVNLRLLKENEAEPEKHQLSITFTDNMKLVAQVQMYGFLFLLMNGFSDYPYYLMAINKPGLLTDEFSEAYFLDLVTQYKETKLSLKAFLATEQRIPGVGNGTIQDVLFLARLHPKRKLSTLTQEEILILYHSLKTTVFEMANKGGRNTEIDLLGNQGGYQTLMSNKTIDKPCIICNGKIVKEAYLGGSVYYCPVCQK